MSNLFKKIFVYIQSKLNKPNNISFDEWYSNLEHNSKSQDYIFYFPNGLESYPNKDGIYQNTKEHIEDITGKYSFAYFSDNSESNELYLEVRLNHTELNEYVKIVHRFGGSFANKYFSTSKQTLIEACKNLYSTDEEERVKAAIFILTNTPPIDGKIESV